MSGTIDLLNHLVQLAGPPGEEQAVADFLISKTVDLGYTPAVDAKGNVLVDLRQTRLDPLKLMVTAHMDEISMIVQRIESDGRIRVQALGGMYPWKLGEGPVEILADDVVPGILSFGSIHTESLAATVRQVENSGLKWQQTYVFTGLSPAELDLAGVRPGCRVVVHSGRRQLIKVGKHIGGYFLDDRSDCVAWLLMLQHYANKPLSALFVGSAAEEVGGEGALYAMRNSLPEVCLALELAPVVPDAPISLSPSPVCWTHDSYSTMSARDGRLVAQAAAIADVQVQFQSLSRGGSDASCAAGKGMVARPITLGIPMENSHGFEIIHEEAIEQLAALATAVCDLILAE